MSQTDPNLVESGKYPPDAYPAVWRWLVAALVIPLLYIASIGPMTPLLTNGSEGAYGVWQFMYGNPLGKLPRPFRSAANAYINSCTRLYCRLQGGP